MNKIERRDFLKFVSIFIGMSFASKLSLFPEAHADDKAFIGMPRKETHGSNFKAIYGNDELRARFHQFLVNVYSIYPNQEFHALILDATQKHETDEEIYAEIQRRLPEITPFMSLLRYSVPTLRHQKEEMARQSGLLLSGTKKINNYVELGSPGTYLHGIKEHIDIDGEVYLLHTDNPHYSPADIIQRGQIRKSFAFVDMNSYAKVDHNNIKPKSVDLIANFVGFHHASAERRRPFIKSVADLLSPGGQLILRDHDVTDPTMAHIVALAHDVFNAGLETSWKINEDEIRNFTTIAQIEDELSALGMRRKGDYLLQDGDPTINTLMIFEKA